MKKLVVAAIAAVMMTGCANLVLRPQCDYNEGPYFCTKQVNKLISRGFDGKPIEQMFMPVLFIDWPFDAVTDTLLWPWDAFAYSRRMRSFGAAPESPFSVEKLEESK